jgi:hypothetical protein
MTAAGFTGDNSGIFVCLISFIFPSPPYSNLPWGGCLTYIDTEGGLEIKVNCTGDAGALENTVPYALATTLEVKEEIGIPLYEEVRVRIHVARVRVSPSE